MASISGKWIFHDEITIPEVQQVNFTCGNASYIGMGYDPVMVWFIYITEFVEGGGHSGSPAYWDSNAPGVAGWETETYKTVDFGTASQTVSEDFYNWLIANADQIPIQISVTANGTTTLATAGKFCDRNIAVAVNVPSLAEELEAKEAELLGVIDGTLEHLKIDVPCAPRFRAFYASSGLKSVEFADITICYNSLFEGCANLKTAIFHKMSGYASVAGTWFQNCSKLTALILYPEHYFVSLSNTNAFTNTPIANGTGYIYVPDGMVDAYKASTNWATYANQIKPLSEFIVTFSTSGTQYQAEANMTWGEWVDSEYNTAGYTIDDNSIVSPDQWAESMTVVVMTPDLMVVSPSDAIDKTISYTEMPV